MTDLAERIRHGVNGAKESMALREEAASEIERLRRVIDRAAATLRKYGTHDDPSAMLLDDLADELYAALRHEPSPPPENAK